MASLFVTKNGSAPSTEKGWAILDKTSSVVTGNGSITLKETKNNSGYSLVQFDNSTWRKEKVLYFEVQLLTGFSKTNFLGVGLAVPLYEGGMLGWGLHTVGYHSDDGFVRYDQGTNKLNKIQLETFGDSGDVIGCLWDLTSGFISFTKNGKLFATKVCRTTINMVPSITGKTPNSFNVNFGAEPFRYALTEAKTLRPKTPAFSSISPETKHTKSNVFFVKTEGVDPNDRAAVAKQIELEEDVKGSFNGNYFECASKEDVMYLLGLTTITKKKVRVFPDDLCASCEIPSDCDLSSLMDAIGSHPTAQKLDKNILYLRFENPQIVDSLCADVIKVKRKPFQFKNPWKTPEAFMASSTRAAPSPSFLSGPAKGTQEKLTQAFNQKADSDGPLIFNPQFKAAMVISMCSYTKDFPCDTMVLDQLPLSENDGDEVSKYLQTIGFENKNIVRLHNVSKDKIETKLEKFLKKAELANEMNAPGLFFLYYSGHGAMANNQTIGYTIQGERFSLEQVTRKMARYPNTFVVGFFDCCRVPVPVEKGMSENMPVPNGQCCLVFASPPNLPAIAFKNRTMSVATESFLGFIQQTKQPFPYCVDKWMEQSKLPVEVTNSKRTHHVYLKK